MQDFPATLTDPIRAHATRQPDRTAFVFEGRQTSFLQLDQRSSQFAHALAAAGIRPGERIAYIGKNTDVFFIALFGAMKAGIVVVPINWRLAAPEIAAIVADAQARLVLLGAEFADDPACTALPGVATCIAAEGHPVLPEFAAWIDDQPRSAPGFQPGGRDVAVQLYTSGTTGVPKGVMLSHANLVSAQHGAALHDLPWMRWRPTDIALLAMPVSHVSGTVWGCIAAYHGATCHIQRQFDLDATFDAIAEHRISKFFLVPAALQMLVRHPRAQDTDFTCIAEMAYGASPMPLPLLRECIAVMKTGFVQLYGMTETTGTIVALPPKDHTRETPRLRAAGLPLPWVELRVVGPDGADVPTGTVGEIITRSAANMAGYWNKSDETARSIDTEGRLRTGDAGYRDADGYLFIYDRMKDMIISGGENVYPAEVESTLAGHPAVADVAVIGVPDPRWGEAVKAIVVLRPDMQLSEAELIAWSRTRIAGFKAPGSVDFTDSLPRNASGKLLKRSLREPYWKDRQRQVN
jgi:acyl-CoA synthetase (AMP-forming)/AMP-acid ligase II